NVVRDGDKVIVHATAGKDIELKPLKRIEKEKALSLEGLIAMKTVRGHVGRMECYTCHAAWAPQCYGCHVKIDYSGGKTSFDWLGAGHRHLEPECAADRGETGYDTTIPGQIEEQRSFTRWEEPALGVNGEGRVTPVAPGCQVSATVIGPDGTPITLNRIFRTTPESEGSEAEGQLSIDMSPTQPHTMTKGARTCESCHLSDKALGYGIGGGLLTRTPSERVVVDLETVDGHILSHDARTQMAPIEGLTADWSRLVTEEGRQLQTVGHHFKRSRPLNNEERAHIDRQGVCLACHQEIPDRSPAVSLLHHVAEYTGQLPKTADQHSALAHKILLLAAWVQAVVAGAVPLAVLAGALWVWRRRKRRSPLKKQITESPPQ
ncbi:MAG: cytochrome C, partial [Planctomycetota bacterium]